MSNGMPSDVGLKGMIAQTYQERPSEIRLAEQQASHILVVDDERPIVDLLCLLLEDEGLQVTGATSAAEAAEIMRSERPDVIITDVMMPGMTGYELARIAKAIDPPVRVVLMSAVVDSPSNARYPFLGKPFDLGEVLDVIDEQLRAS